MSDLEGHMRVCSITACMEFWHVKDWSDTEAASGGSRLTKIAQERMRGIVELAELALQGFIAQSLFITSTFEWNDRHSIQ